MKHFMIKYQFANGTRGMAPGNPEFISALDNDPDSREEISTAS